MKHIIVIGVTDVAYGLPRNGVEIEFGLCRDFAAYHHQVAFCVSLARDAAVRVLRQAGIQNRIGDGIAHFVRMALADGLRRKDVIFAHVTRLLDGPQITY